MLRTSLFWMYHGQLFRSGAKEELPTRSCLSCGARIASPTAFATDGASCRAYSLILREADSLGSGKIPLR